MNEQLRREWYLLCMGLMGEHAKAGLDADPEYALQVEEALREIKAAGARLGWDTVDAAKGVLTEIAERNEARG